MPKIQKGSIVLLSAISSKEAYDQIRDLFNDNPEVLIVNANFATEADSPHVVDIRNTIYNFVTTFQKLDLLKKESRELVILIKSEDLAVYFHRERPGLVALANRIKRDNSGSVDTVTIIAHGSTLRNFIPQQKGEDPHHVLNLPLVLVGENHDEVEACW